MANQVKIGGTWRDVADTYVKINGVWRKATDIYCKINGVWRNSPVSQASNIVINITPDGTTTGRMGQNATINIIDPDAQLRNVQYAWSTSASTPPYGFTLTANNSTVYYTHNDIGNVYLHVRVRDLSGNLYDKVSNPFKNINSDFIYYINRGNAIISGYRGTNSTVRIPSSLAGAPVVTIDDNAFAWNSATNSHENGNTTRITSVTIPNTVTTLGSRAFDQQRISNIVVPSSVQTVGTGAFSANVASSIVLSEGIKTIKHQAFSVNSGVKTLTIPSSVTLIEDSAFDGLYSLETVTCYSRNAVLEPNIFSRASSNLLIRAYSNSTMMTYAQQNGHRFQAL